MSKLSEVSKHAIKLYSDFVKDYNNYLEYNENYDVYAYEESDYIDDMITGYTDEIISDCGHYDEQLLLNYWAAQDEDGNYTHPYDVYI